MPEHSSAGDRRRKSAPALDGDARRARERGRLGARRHRQRSAAPAEGPRLARRDRRRQVGKRHAAARDRRLVAPARCRLGACARHRRGQRLAPVPAELTAPGFAAAPPPHTPGRRVQREPQGASAAEGAFDGALRARFGALGDHAAGAGPQALDRLQRPGHGPARDESRQRRTATRPCAPKPRARRPRCARSTSASAP